MYFSCFYRLYIFKIWTAANANFHFSKRLLTPLDALYRYKRCPTVIRQVSSRSDPFLSFSITESAIHFSFLFFNRYQTLPFFALPTTRFLSLFISFHHLLVFSFSFHLIVIIQLYLPHCIKVVNRDFFIFFFDILQCKESHASFTGGMYKVLDFLQWVRKSLSDEAKELVAVRQNKVSRRKQPAVVLGFQRTNDAVIRESGTQKIRQVLWTSMATSAHAEKDGHVEELVAFLFCDVKVVVAPVNRADFPWHILESSCRKTESTSVNMTTPTTFEVMFFFHCCSFLNYSLRKTTLKIPEVCHASMVINFSVERMLKAWKELFSRSAFTDFSKAMAP